MRFRTHSFRNVIYTVHIRVYMYSFPHALVYANGRYSTETLCFFPVDSAGTVEEIQRIYMIIIQKKRLIFETKKRTRDRENTNGRTGQVYGFALRTVIVSLCRRHKPL